MTTSRKQRNEGARQGEAEWLQQLLADIHTDVSRQPSAQAIERIRARLLTEIRAPVRAAA